MIRALILARPTAALLGAAFAVSLASAAPLRADALEDGGFLETCVETHLPDGTAEAEARCVGLISTACAKAPDAAEEDGETACLRREHDAWSALMDDWEPELLAAAVALDTREDRQNASADAFRQAQRAWENFAAAECGYAAALWGRSTYREVALADCEMRAIARRAIQLRAQMGLETR